MQEGVPKTATRSYSLLFALLAFLGVGLVLSPIVWVIFDKYFKLYLFGSPPPDAWKDDTIVLVTFFLWLMLSTAAGGFVQAIKSKTREHIFAWFPLIAGLIGILFLQTDIRPAEFLILFGIMGLGVGGSLVGSWMGKKRKAKRVSGGLGKVSSER